MTPGERVGEAIAVAILLAGAAFFMGNQFQQTGFFTSAFGPLEMLLFYSCVPMGLATCGVRMVCGRRNLARPFEALSAAVTIVSSVWLFIVFPFDFTRIATLVPDALKFLAAWIPNWLARDVLILAFAAGVGNLIYTPLLYSSVRRSMKVDVAATI